MDLYNFCDQVLVNNFSVSASDFRILLGVSLNCLAGNKATCLVGVIVASVGHSDIL